MEQIRKIIPEPVRDWTPVILVTAGGLHFISKAWSSLIANNRKKRMLNKWKDSPKDVVVLHTGPPGKTAPSISPFPLKLETYLRMANIPYQIDYEYPFAAETGKTPWITLNGQHYSDSQLIIEMLAKKYDKTFGNYRDTDLALGTAVRVMIEEHFVWGVIMWRYVQDGEQQLQKLVDFPVGGFFKPMARNAWCQGIARLKDEDVFHIMGKDLRALSVLLGNKKFILGDEASEVDCAVFGMLVQIMYCSPGSPYEKMVKEDLPNLKAYVLRMKETYWPDWGKCLIK